MTPKELEQIKARCEAAKSVPVHCKRCKWFTDLPKCVAEIERLRTAMQEIIIESGKVDINNWPAQQQICQSIARKALEIVE